MKTTVRISATLGNPRLDIFTSNIVITEEQLAQLSAIYPKGRGRGGFSAEIAEDDPRYHKIVGLIEQWTGRVPKHSGGPVAPHEFAAFRTREFDSKELETYQLFYLRGRQILGDLDAQTTDGQLIIREGSIDSACGLGSLPPSPSIGMNDTVRGLMCNEGFLALGFREILLSKMGPGQKELAFQSSRRVDLAWASERAEIKDHSKAEIVLWQLRGMLTLPPFQNRVIDGNNRVLDAGPRDSCFAVDDAYPPMLVYSRAEVGELPQFDVAETQETIGNGERNAASFVVVSKRFRRWVLEQKLTGVYFVPVRLV